MPLDKEPHTSPLYPNPEVKMLKKKKVNMELELDDFERQESIGGKGAKQESF